MSKKTFAFILTFSLFIGLVFADEIVLRNGKNGYTGCIDTYIESIGNGTDFAFKMQDSNHHDSVQTKTAN